MTTTPVRVAIGIPTYRRPGKLVELLDALPERIAELGDEAVVVRIVIADNDSAGSAATEAARERDLPIRYLVVDRPGIAAVRNRILAESDADVVAYLDDDERPLDGWLSALVATWLAHDRPAAVMGRVISKFATEPDPWVVATGQFRRPERPTGMVLTAAAAGNLLVDVGQVRDRGVRFDESIGLAGGEDTLFSKQLIAAGGVIIWCNESRAVDTVVAERATRGWVMSRAFSSGNSTVHAELGATTSVVRRGIVRVTRFIGGAARVVVGAARHAWGRLRGNVVHDARGLRAVHRGRGMITAALGRRHHEYSRATP